MQRSTSFGRRTAPSVAVAPAAPKRRAEPAADERPAAPAPARESVALPQDDLPSVEQEIKEWKAARKRSGRSVREPWRSVSVAAGLAFAATSWLVPASVANVAELALGVLTAGSLYTGWRARKPPPSS